ncbi:MAG: hypothetical protein K6F00_02100 [Lachnospiraceae bacterium]|nr:hypothetical protein [Lachnospiraceae bacterium]
MKYKLTQGDYKNQGSCLIDGAAVFTFEADYREDVFLVLYDKRSKRLVKEIKLGNEYRMGRVWSVRIEGPDFSKLCYRIRVGEVETEDPNAMIIVGREKWMNEKRYKNSYEIYGGIASCKREWEPSHKRTAPDKMIIYKLHMRGFTMKHQLQASMKGNYKGVMALLPELKKMGITTLEFMPLYEFEEIRFHKHLEMDENNNTITVCEEPFGTNYWGYGQANYLAPKSSYFPGISPDDGMRELVKAIHGLGMDIIMEFSFEKKISGRSLENILQSWVKNYHIDGFHLLGEGLPIEEITSDPLLADTMIMHEAFSNEVIDSEVGQKRLFVYNPGFLYSMRKIVNHLDGSMAEFASTMRRQGVKSGFINYAANTTGFTLWDCMSYGEKHNEANGEDNRDGSNYNCSFNHGQEGPSRLRNVNRSRFAAIRSSLLLTLFSQAVPLINEGDEVLNSQNGNNNPYGQDNPIAWVDFSKKKTSQAMKEYVRSLIEFRRAHPVLSMDTPFRESDYARYGIPDISYHGREPWIMGIGAEKKGLGILYNGSYGKNKCEDVLLCLNFYYGEETFALPRLPEGRKWYFVTNTASEDFSMKGVQVETSQSTIVPGSSISVFIGK